MSVLVGTLEVARVEFLVEVGLTLICDSIKPSRNPGDEAISGEFRKPITSVPSDRAPEVLYSLRGQIPFLAQKLKYAIVTGNHPIRRLTHPILRICCQTHSGVGYRAILTGRY